VRADSIGVKPYEVSPRPLTSSLPVAHQHACVFRQLAPSLVGKDGERPDDAGTLGCSWQEWLAVGWGLRRTPIPVCFLAPLLLVGGRSHILCVSAASFVATAAIGGCQRLRFDVQSKQD